MAAPLDADKRAAILADIQAGELGRNAIARAHTVSASTVTLIAKQENVEGAFDRSHTRAALEARTVDLAVWRAGFAQRMAERAEWLESRMDDAQQQVVPTKDGPELVRVELSGREAQAYMVAIGIAVDKINVLTRDDAQGLASVDAWLRSLTGLETTS